MFIIQLFLRAFSSNLRKVPVGAGEQAALSAKGITNPTLQRYLGWRRSIFLVVIVATVLSAVLATAHELGVFDDAPEDAAAVEETSGDEPAPEPPPKKNTFEHFADTVHLVSLYAVPLSTLAALLCWTRLSASFRILVAGWCVSSFVPMVIAMCPWSWWGYDPTEGVAEGNPLDLYQHLAEGAKDAVEYLITLLPIVVSLIPGAQRACLRLKTLLPASMLPGWFVVSVAPIFSLLLLVMFVAVNQVAENPLFLVGMLLLLAAPLVFLVRYDVLTRPLVSESDYLQLRLTQLAVSVTTALGGILVVVYLCTQKVMDIHLVGFDDNALLSPTDLFEYFLEIIGRSLFITALCADLFMRMNLATWRHSKGFAGTPESDKYDETLGEFQGQMA